MDPTDPRDRRRPGRQALVGGAAAVTIVAAGVGWAVLRLDGSSSDGRPRPLSLKTDSQALVATGMARIVGRRLYAGSDPISADLAAGERLQPEIAASLVPLAVREDAVTDVVVYSTWRSSAPDLPAGAATRPEPVTVGRPSIRVWRGVGGTDDLVADGAYAPAVGPNGVIAYAKGVAAERRTDGPYLARIVVGSLDSPSTSWWTTTPGRYVPVAWAGSQLLAYVIGEDDSLELQAFSGPDSSRTLMRSATLIAVSPDGTQVAVAERQGTIALVDVESGGIADAVGLRGTGDGPDPGVVRPGGGWRGTRIVASTARGLVVLDTAPTLHVAAFHPSTKAMPGGISEPQFVNDDTVIGTARLPDGTSTATPPETRAPTALVVCTLSASSCARGSIGPTTFAWRQWVTNWSR